MNISMLAKISSPTVVVAHPCLRRGRGASPTGGAA